jgi:hypothetical protein
VSGELELEVKTSIVELVNWSRGTVGLALRVDWRKAGARRWDHFNLVPDEGQTIAELRAHADEAARLVVAGRVVDLPLDDYSARPVDGDAA